MVTQLAFLLKQVIQGGGEDQQRRGNGSHGQAVFRDSLVASNGEFVSVVGLNGSLLCELHVEGVLALKLLPLRQTLDFFAVRSGVSVNSH
jgi:hypothetical protein